MERASGSGGGSSDFVKKLYKMLEDPTYRHIVRWNDMGDSFIVLDNTEFTKNVLPRHFKHSNFASFVRQLNKYDFHKIRNTDEPGGSQYGEQAWEFKHPNFQMHNRDQLENIRRKAPAARKSAQKATSEDPSALQAAFDQITELQSQLQRLKDSQKGIDHQLERNDTMCQALVAQVGNMHKKLMDYEDLVQRLVVQLAQKEIELRARGMAGIHDMEGNEYFERAAASLKYDGSEEQNLQPGGSSGSNEEDEEAEDGDDGDEYDDMEDEMDEDMDGNEGEDGSANDEDYMPTSTSIPSQGLTPFIMENSTPLGQNYDQGERDANASVSAKLEMDEILESRNWPIGPFDPGGVTVGHALDEQNSRSVFDILLSKSTKDTQSWLKLPKPQARSVDGINAAISPSGGASPHSSGTTSSGNMEDTKTTNGTAEPTNGKRQESDPDSAQVSRSRAAVTATPQISVTYDKEAAMRDGVITQGLTGFYLPPITEVSSLSSSGPGLLSQLKQTLDAANIDKGKGKEAGGITLERRPPDSRYYTAPILVVDDDPGCRRLLMLFFGYNKQEVDCASDGVSAVEKVKNHKYSIIFMDVILPLLDGVSATKLMRKTDKETPIVCLASTANVVDLERYKRSGMNLVLSKPFGFKKLYDTMMKIMPESMGWAIPRGLRSKRNKGTKGQQASINGLSDGGNTTMQSVICGSAGVEGEMQLNGVDSPMTDPGNSGASEENAGKLVSQGSTPYGPFCLRPMSIANLINEKNYDPKKRELMDMEQQNGTESGQVADHKKRRLEISSNSPTNTASGLDFERSSSHIDTQPTISDYDISFPMETPSSISTPAERNTQSLDQVDKTQLDRGASTAVSPQGHTAHQVLLPGSMIMNPPPQGSFNFALEAQGLQDTFVLSRTPSGTAMYPIEGDYMPAKMEAQDDSPLRLDTYPAHYQPSENVGLPMSMSRGAQRHISSGSAVGIGSAMNGLAESTNPANFSYDEYRVD